MWAHERVCTCSSAYYWKLYMKPDLLRFDNQFWYDVVWNNEIVSFWWQKNKSIWMTANEVERSTTFQYRRKRRTRRRQKQWFNLKFAMNCSMHNATRQSRIYLFIWHSTCILRPLPFNLVQRFCKDTYHCYQFSYRSICYFLIQWMKSASANSMSKTYSIKITSFQLTMTIVECVYLTACHINHTPISISFFTHTQIKSK